jgi:hypothetical protein
VWWVSDVREFVSLVMEIPAKYLSPYSGLWWGLGGLSGVLGYYRRRYGTLYEILGDSYRYRSMCESTFGSLTSQFNDGVKTRRPRHHSNKNTGKTNIQHIRDMDKNNKSDNRIIGHPRFNNMLKCEGILGFSERLWTGMVATRAYVGG